MADLQIADWVIAGAFDHMDAPATPADYLCLEGYPDLQALVRQRGDNEGWGAPPPE
jgi:hypothetical protein